MVGYRVLGPVEATEDGRSLPLGGRRQRAILAILLMRANEVVTRDALVDLLWDGRPPEGADHAIEVYISRLRQAIPAGDGEAHPLETRPPGYRLRLDEDQVDANRFAALLESGRRALAAGEAAQARLTLGQAL